MELMAVDKKAAKGKTRFVLLEAIGRAALRGGVERGAGPRSHCRCSAIIVYFSSVMSF